MSLLAKEQRNKKIADVQNDLGTMAYSTPINNIISTVIIVIILKMTNNNNIDNFILKTTGLHGLLPYCIHVQVIWYNVSRVVQ